MRDGTLPFRSRAGSIRFVTRHPKSLLKCVKPAICAPRTGQITRYVEYDANSNVGVVYYAKEGLRDMDSSTEFSGELGLVTYLAIWLRCEHVEGGWPAPAEAAAREGNGHGNAEI